jgi:hypothetical protein
VLHQGGDTARFKEDVYTLHAFQKKSPAVIKSALAWFDLVAHRLKIAGATRPTPVRRCDTTR